MGAEVDDAVAQWLKGLKGVELKTATEPPEMRVAELAEVMKLVGQEK